MEKAGLEGITTRLPHILDIDQVPYRPNIKTPFFEMDFNMTTMTDHRTALRDLFIACWKDEDLRNRFKEDPTSVLAEYDMTIPEGIDVDVVENNDTVTNITMPKAPADLDSLSDEEIMTAATGSHNIKAINEILG